MRIGMLVAVVLAVVSCGGGPDIGVGGPSDQGAGDLRDVDARDARDPGSEVRGDLFDDPDAVVDPETDVAPEDSGPEATTRDDILASTDDGDATPGDLPDVSDDDATIPDDVPATADDGTITADDAPATPDDTPALLDDGATTPDTPDIPDTPDVPDVPSTGPLAIRFMAANLSSGDGQDYDLGHGIRLMAGAKADILMVQEFNYLTNSDADYRKMSDAICGAECQFHVGVGQIPNGIVSRWPITDSGFWDDPYISNRDLDWVRIDLPGPKDLVAVSVHLHTSPSSDQVGAAKVIAQKVTEYRAAHPDCCWYVVGGDFNGPSAVSANGFGTYNSQPVFYVAGPDPVGNDGNENTNAGRSSQYDFVLVDTALHAYQTPLVVTASDGSAPLTFPSGLVFDTRDFSATQMSRYFAPALTGDSGAPSMQHMGILKSVLIPR
jgi:endonuclease/exonuclease/phosphatase family metal-dependent hydrolase